MVSTDHQPGGRGSAFYDNPRLSVLLVLFIFILGSVAITTLARQEDPTLTERYATIATFLPGATASRVESLISEPLETRLREIPEISEMSSSSRAGYSIISLDLYDAIEANETDVIWSEGRDKLADASPGLPTGSSVPELEVANAM